MNTYYYHSRPEIDPKGKGKRVSVACVITNNKMCFGTALQNISMKDVFRKDKGRKIAEERAMKKPCLIVECPSSNVKQLFLEEACKLVKLKLDPTKSPQKWESTIERTIENLERKQKYIAAEVKNLKSFLKSHQPTMQPTAAELNPQ